MDSSGFDPHLNITLPLLHNWPPGFNAMDWLLRTPSLVHDVRLLQFPTQSKLLHPTALSVLAEVIFALVTLALDHVWLSSIAVAVKIFVAVAVNQSSMVEEVGTYLKWALLAPLRRLSPHVVSQLEQPDIRFKFGAPHKDIFRKMKRGMKSIITLLHEEHTNKIEWIRHPSDASKAYIEKENMSFAAQRKQSSASRVPATEQLS